MLRFVFPTFLALIVSVAGFAQGTGGLIGRVKEGVYNSPTGAFRIEIPVLQELGGTISDSENVVVFQDQFNVHLSIGCFPQDATQRWELSTRGLKDYLTAFFSNFVMPDFSESVKGARIESTSFDPKLLGGTFIVHTLLPGGTMFNHRLAQVSDDSPLPVAKRGNFLFVRHGFIYVISIELAERVLEGSTYHLTPAEENTRLRERLDAIIDKMSFIRPPADAK